MNMANDHAVNHYFSNGFQLIASNLPKHGNAIEHRQRVVRYRRIDDPHFQIHYHSFVTANTVHV